MTHSVETKAALFRALHQPGRPFVIPNPWDAGSARVLERQGFSALATTSSGFALTLGRRDYRVTREEALAHARAIVDAVDIPVSADLENGFGPAPEDVATTIAGALDAGLAGGSIEDSTGDASRPVFEAAHAVERVAAAVEAAGKGPDGFVLTARAEAFLYGPADLDEVIARLVQFVEVGADVVYAPGLPDLAAVRAVCAAVDKPVNVLVIGALAKSTVQDFADAGAARLSLGGNLAWTAYSAMAAASALIRSEGHFEGLKPTASARDVSEALRD